MKKLKKSRKLDEAYSISKNLILNSPKFGDISHTFSTLAVSIHVIAPDQYKHACRKKGESYYSSHSRVRKPWSQYALLAQDLHIASKSYLLNSYTLLLFSFPDVTKKPSSSMQNKLCKAKPKWRCKKHPLKWDLERTFLQTTCLQLSTWWLVIYEHTGLWRFVTMNTAHQKCMANYSKKTHSCADTYVVPLKEKEIIIHQSFQSQHTL